MKKSQNTNRFSIEKVFPRLSKILKIHLRKLKLITDNENSIFDINYLWSKTTPNGHLETQIRSDQCLTCTLRASCRSARLWDPNTYWFIGEDLGCEHSGQGGGDVADGEDVAAHAHRLVNKGPSVVKHLPHDLAHVVQSNQMQGGRTHGDFCGNEYYID